MKKYLLVSLTVLSAFAKATTPPLPEFKVELVGRKVQVGTAYAAPAATRYIATQVDVVATFGNPCKVPTEAELVKMISVKGRDLYITLVQTDNKMCPQVAQPTTVKLNLGRYTHPADGRFDRVFVNGKEAIQPIID